MNVPRLPWWLAPNGAPPESIIAQPTEQKQLPPSSSYKPTPLTEAEIEARLSRAYTKALEMQKVPPLTTVMNQPESPHQAAIAGGTFKAKVRPTLAPAAAELVRIYEAVPGAITYPGCCPEGLAAVLSTLAAEPYLADRGDLLMFASMLRGWQP